MIKRLALAVILCLFFFNSALYSSAAQNEINHNNSRIAGKQTFLSAQKQNLQKQDIETLKAETLKNKKIGPVLNNFLAGKGNAYVKKTGPNKDMIRLIVNTTNNKTPVYNAANKYNAKILHKGNGMMTLEVPAENVENLVNETDAIKNVRLPARFYPLAVTSEAVSLFGAGNFHNAGHTGAGARIAIIDVGFKGLTEAYRNGDIPYGVRTHDFTGNGLETEYYHGTACAELVYDMAPGAELYLLKIYDEIDIYYAIDYCIANGIDIISVSLGASGTGPGDGTGPLDEYFDKASDSGILVVAAAGNYANYGYDENQDGIIDYYFGGHWEGQFYDSDNDGIHEFVQDSQEIDYNVISAYASTNDDNEPSTGEVSVLLRWNDDWDNAVIDYDLYLYKYDDAGDKIGDFVQSSNTVQNGNYQSPVEQIIIDLDDEFTHYFAIEVRKASGETVDTDFEIYLAGTSTFVPFGGPTSAISTSGSSITEPADAESVLAVGAIYYDTWTGSQEDFSSQGPTNAWAGRSARIKPDICGPDGVSTYTFGVDSFFGTSASTPIVAGAATLILSINPAFEPDDLKSSLETNAIDMGAVDKDNLYGSGRINLLSLDISADPDADDDGMPDSWELLYDLDNTNPNDSADNPDNDGYTNLMEYNSGTNPLDADTDDDGISDGDEDADKDGILDTGETFPTRTDSDDDWIQDGTEQGVTEGVPDPDGSGPLTGTDTTVFKPDSDPSTTTDPMNADADGDELKDGEEDSNRNGMVDSGETDPNDNNGVDDDDSDDSDGDGGGGGCFIATAAYGSYLEPHVVILRQFRDKILLKSSWGKAFVKLYLRYSPPAADFIAEHDTLRAMARWSLLPLIWLSQATLLFGVKGTLVILISISTFMFLALLLLFKRRVFVH